MPSTYSTLKIQLMATGENNTTWGTVTNTNLGTAIEEAIVGSADVTFASANVTLSLTDTNATQAARNVRLRCTGATGGSSRNLVVPSIEKPYIVKNDCADSVVVKTSAGSGITVPAGKTMWVYSDGTNVVDITTHLSSLTLGTALAVAQGGTGATDAATARTNLGLGSIATQASSAVSITGGSVTGITDLAVADGGTGASTASGARTNLGASTVGANIFTLTNPSAVTFPRINADNTVSTLDATSFRTAIGATGTVTSVDMSVPAFLSVSGSPITASGTLAVSLSGTALPVANGGTGGTSAATAQAALSVPSTTGTGASGTWAIGISGNAATATNATNAANVITTNFSIVESGGYLYIKYGATNIARIDSSGNFIALANVTAYGSI